MMNSILDLMAGLSKDQITPAERSFGQRQWFSTVNLHQSHPKGLPKHRLLASSHSSNRPGEGPGNLHVSQVLLHLHF